MADIVKPLTLINDEYFKAFSPVPQNIDCTDFQPYYSIVEELYIKPIVGDTLFGEMMEAVSGGTVTGATANLLLETYKLEAFCIVEEALPFLGYRINEIGITLGKTENADSVKIGDIDYISNHLKSQISLLKDYYKKWLWEHRDYFPSYRPDCEYCNCDGWDNVFETGSDKYEVRRRKAWHNLRKFKPLDDRQLYSTARENINIE